MSANCETLLEEWLAVLGELWTAVEKPVDAKRLKVYQKALGEVPLGLLELAVKRVIRENTYHVVPLPGVVWAAVRKELGDPFDIRVAIEGWVEGQWNRVDVKAG
jgi:hypothetical protein